MEDWEESAREDWSCDADGEWQVDESGGARMVGGFGAQGEDGGEEKEDGAVLEEVAKGGRDRLNGGGAFGEWQEGVEGKGGGENGAFG